jgi:hypothetical protein
MSLKFIDARDVMRAKVLPLTTANGGSPFIICLIRRSVLSVDWTVA